MAEDKALSSSISMKAKIGRNIIFVWFLIVQGCVKSEITLIAAPEVLAIPIKENNEPLLDLRHHTMIAFGPSPEIPGNNAYTKIRKTVYDKLVEAQSLLPPNLRLCLYEGYRSVSLQDKLFQERYAKVRKAHPEWDHEEVFIETTKLVSPIINLDGSTNTPPHSTGGAVDVYLLDIQGQHIDMGIYPKDWMSDQNGALSLTSSRQIPRVAQRNRQVMNEVLMKVGFVNYPTEYWHWSYGDRYWAYQTEQDAAIYGGLND